MNSTKISRGLLAAAGFLLSCNCLAQSFTYQGFLNDAGAPANGSYTLQFRLMDSPNGGAQVGPLLLVPDTPVLGGLFTVSLDFGVGAFAGSGDRWLEIAVAATGRTNYVVLAPRQLVEAAPRALTLEWPASGTAACTQAMLGLTNASSGTVVDAANSGTGIAVRASVTNTSSSTNAFVATHAGSGRALFVQANGTGQAAFIRNSNTGNTQTALNVTTNGNGSAADFKVLDLDGDQPAVRVTHEGVGPALYCESSDPEAAALEVKGPISLVGDGSFIRVTGVSPDYHIVLHHPLLNNNPSAVLFIQDRASAYGASPLVYPDYDEQTGRWWLRQRYQPVQFWGNTYDVLILKREYQ
jgi:hypothetical protein